jgi:hypothetical protein
MLLPLFLFHEKEILEVQVIFFLNFSVQKIFEFTQKLIEYLRLYYYQELAIVSVTAVTLIVVYRY